MISKGYVESRTSLTNLMTENHVSLYSESSPHLPVSRRIGKLLAWNYYGLCDSDAHSRITISIYCSNLVAKKKSFRFMYHKK